MNKREAIIYTIGKLDGKFSVNKDDSRNFVCLKESFGKNYAKYDITIRNIKSGMSYVLYKNLGQYFDENKPSVEIMAISAKMPKERVYDLLLTALAFDKKYDL